MGFAQHIGTGLAIATTAIAAEARPTSVDPADIGIDPAAAITTTYDPTTDRQAMMLARDGAAPDATPSSETTRAVSAEPPARDESPGSKLLRRSLDRKEGRPVDAPEAPAPQAEVKPAAATPATTNAAVEPQPASTQPVAATPEVRPEVKTGTAFDRWKALTPEQIQQLSPEEMTKLLADRDTIMREGALAARTAEQRQQFLQIVNDVLVGYRDQGPAAQLKALRETLDPILKGEKMELDGWAKGQEEQRRGLATGLVNGIPVAIVEQVNGMNMARAEFKGALGVLNNEAAMQQDYSYANYVMNRDAYNKAGRDLWLPQIQLPDFGVFQRGQAEKKPEEIEAERKKAKEEMAKLPQFEAYKGIEDVGAKPIVQAAAAPIDMTEAVRLIMGPAGERTLTPGEQRIKIGELGEFVTAARADQNTWTERQAELLRSIDAEATPAIKETIKGMLAVRDTLTRQRLDLERSQNDLNVPAMSEDQQMAMSMYVTTKQDEYTAGVVERDAAHARNMERVNTVNVKVNEYIADRQREYEKDAKFRHNPIGGVLDGVFGR